MLMNAQQKIANLSRNILIALKKKRIFDFLYLHFLLLTFLDWAQHSLKPVLQPPSKSEPVFFQIYKICGF